MGVGTVLFLFVVAVCGVCNGEVYKVGDSAAWTLIAHPDYNTWASSKTFRVGDTLRKFITELVLHLALYLRYEI